MTLRIKHLFFVDHADRFQDNALQCQTIAFLSLICALVITLFALRNFVEYKTTLGIVECIASGLFITSFYFAKRDVSLAFKSALLMATAMLLLFVVFIDGGSIGDGYVWSCLLPFLAAFLMDIQRAWYWILAYAIAIMIAITAHLLGLYNLPYNDGALLYFVALYTVSSLLAALFKTQVERINTHYKNNILELEDLKAHLKESVELKTSELRKSNIEMQREVQRHKDTAQTLKETEQRFYQAQKMETIGTLVGGIAHDFNNMLAGINANLFMIKRKAQDNPEVINRSEDIEQLVINASDIIRQLLTFSRQDRVQFQYFDLGPFIDEAFKLANISISKDIAITLDNNAGSLPIYGNKTQIQQVLMNMLNNARDALKGVDQPSITIRIIRYQPSERFKNTNPQMTADKYVKIIIMDNGTGMSAEEVDKIFEPFFTTKEVGKGTGLGLSMCYGAIQSHEGLITVKSELGKGTDFHIYIPLSHHHTLDNALPISDMITKSMGQTILLVDDNEQLRLSQKYALEDLGYQILEAENGEKAVELFVAHQSDIDLTLMDITMPVMGGVAAAEKIRAIQADAPIIYVTGHDKDGTLDDDQLPAPDDFVLEKPYSMKKLHEVIYKRLCQDGI